MPYGNLTINNFANWNYFLFHRIKIPLAWGSTLLFDFEKIHSG
jgi:hypothetical protein